MRKLTKREKNELRALRRMPDRDIDTTGIPPTTDWSKAAVGKFYRLVKQSSTPNPHPADPTHPLPAEQTPPPPRILK